MVNPLVLSWIAATGLAAILFLPQLMGYLRTRDLPVGLGAAGWLGTGIIAILFGNLMVSFGAPAIAEEFGVPVWTVVATNHAANFGAAVGLLAATRFVGLPRWTPLALAGSGVAIGAAPFMPNRLGLAVTLFIFGALSAWSVLNPHVRVLASVAMNQRAETMGRILAPCLVVGVALVGVPTIGGWRLGLWTIAVIQLVLAATFRSWKGAPEPTRIKRRPLREAVTLAWLHKRLMSGVCANFAGWVLVYTIPSLMGVSESGVVVMASFAQALAAVATTPIGRLADRNRRLVAYLSMLGLALALLGTAVMPALPALRHAVLGVPVGWWLCAVFFTIGEASGNFNQGVLEAEVSLQEKPVQTQLVALAMRFFTVGTMNVAVAGLTGVLVFAVGSTQLGLIVGGVAAVVVVIGKLPAVRKMKNENPS